MATLQEIEAFDKSGRKQTAYMNTVTHGEKEIRLDSISKHIEPFFWRCVRNPSFSTEHFLIPF